MANEKNLKLDSGKVEDGDGLGLCRMQNSKNEIDYALVDTKHILNNIFEVSLSR